MTLAFPALFPPSDPVLERQFQQRILIQCSALLRDEEGSEQERAQLEEVDEVVRKLLAPKRMNPKNAQNSVLNFERNLETSCMELEQRGVVNPSSLTLYQFYSRIQHFQNAAKKAP